ncbi:hypothetical protein LTR78_008552 [Recurvomyces mirabilis]|uniref:Uncharacterized protein n=1 Tax=Recurvomyces mirabilis TaxID=574656 RepID=A0AAE0TT37_9PEZI|nr:hypothetical protein LTR78_008552 [Recurvomyces mirabilis]KAK5156303.1 hypothetical protein LTS14_005191 [Recurvomyces mirabilis]
MAPRTRQGTSHARSRCTATEPKQPTITAQAGGLAEAASPSLVTANKDITGFSDLPREPRDMVYHYSLTTLYGDDIYLNNSSLRAEWYISALPLLETCQAVHDEGVLILYGHNTLRIELLTSSSTWRRESGRVVQEGSLSLGAGMNHPGLAEKLKVIPSRHFRHVRCLKFAFHAYDFRMKRIVGRDDRQPYNYSKLAHFMILVRVRPRARFSLTYFTGQIESRDLSPQTASNLIQRLQLEGRRVKVLTKSSIFKLAYRVRTTCDVILEDELLESLLY